MHHRTEPRQSCAFWPLAAAAALCLTAPLASGQFDFRTPIFEDLTRIGIPLDAAVGDLDNDGFDDVVITLAHPEDPDVINGRLLVLYNRGPMANPADMFEFRIDSFVTLGVTQRPSSVELSDYDQDGFLDIIVVSAGIPGDTVVDPLSVLLNSQDHTTGFIPSDVLTIDVGNEPIDIAVADFDEDGDEDFAVLLLGDMAFVIASNEAGALRDTVEPPALGEPEDLPGLADPTTIEPGDMDNASGPDLAILDGGSSQLRIALQSSLRSFDQVTIQLGGIPADLTVGDLVATPINATAGDEIAVTLPGEGVITVFVRDPQTGEYMPTDIPADPFGVPAIPLAIENADLNNDGVTDLAYVVELDLTPRGRIGEIVTVIRSLPNESVGGVPMFGDPVDVEPETPPTILLTGDLNNDGRPDFVTVNQNEVNLDGPPDVTSVVGNPDPNNPACEYDLNYDGAVDLTDLLTTLAFFGLDTAAGDANSDGVTDIEDLLLILEFFGATCGDRE